MSRRTESHTSTVPFTISSDSEDDVSTTISEKAPVRKQRPSASMKPAAQNEEELSMDLMCTTTSALSKMTESPTTQPTRSTNRKPRQTKSLPNKPPIAVTEHLPVQSLAAEENASHATPDPRGMGKDELFDRGHHQTVDEATKTKFSNSKQKRSVARPVLVNRHHLNPNKLPSVSLQQADIDSSSSTADESTSHADDSDSITSDRMVLGELRRSCSNLQPLQPPTLNHHLIFFSNLFSFHVRSANRSSFILSC